ncbi:hypothetical protein EAM01S_10_00030 [Erwinia amylovora NBRC 12687 = CFBP 1232]|nr:hypothetical protein EAM01S_10_00030 [Erwinia amylovora NBRC 12687 = CFBP 1232]
MTIRNFIARTAVNDAPTAIVKNFAVEIVMTGHTNTRFFNAKPNIIAPTITPIKLRPNSNHVFLLKLSFPFHK